MTSLYLVVVLALFHYPLLTQSSLAAEKLVLHRFFDVAGGEHWDRRFGWKQSNIPVCSWYGITCLGGAKKNGTVVDINLARNNLVGRVTKLIYTLPNLKHLDVSENPGITEGGFAGVGSAHSLSTLLFTSCNLKSLSGLQNASLKELHLTENKLTGRFPSEILNLTKLEKVFLSFNKITGQLPTKIGLFSNLRELYLYDNLVNGTIPTQIGLLSALQVLTMAKNRLKGSLPTQLNTLRSLKVLSLYSQTGPLNGPLLSFSGVPYLTELYLDGNRFSGTVPNSMLLNSKATNSLVKVGLTNNVLSGPLPLALTRFKKLDIDLSGNLISSIPAQFCLNYDWMDGLVKVFGCSAILCPIGTYNKFGRQVESNPCLACSTSIFLGSTTCPAPARPAARPTLKPVRPSVKPNVTPVKKPVKPNS